MEFCCFRDFAVPLLGLSTRYPSIHEMRVTQLVDSILASHFQTPPETSLLKQTAQTQRNAARITLAMIISEKHAVQSGETIRNSLSLNHKSAAPTYLGYRLQNNRTVCVERSDSLLFEARAKRVFGAAA